MSGFLDHLLSLDAAGEHREIAGYIHGNKHSTDILYQVVNLLKESRYLEAHIISKLLTSNGIHNPVLSLSHCVGGHLFGNPADEQYGLASLAALLDHAPVEQRRIFGREIVHPTIAQLMFTCAVKNPAVALGLLEIYKAGMPDFRRIFDWTRDDTVLDPNELSRQGHERARLISFAGPPAGTPRRPLTAIVAMREQFFPAQPDSRLFDFGPLISAAMCGYGWKAQHYAMNYINLAQDFAGIIALCEREKADLLFLDDYFVLKDSYHALRAAVIARIRQLLPNIKIVSVHLDPWAIDAATLVSTSALVDGVWAPHPSMPIWQHPVFAGKMLFMPFPLAGHCKPPTTPLSPRLTFTGSVMGFNWHRAFWLAGAAHGLPIETALSTHKSDGLSALDSHAAYMARIESTGCSVNFSMRPDLSRVLTARVFETTMAGALLVQEDTTEIDYFFVAGDHYLNFDSVRDLRAIARFIADQPEQAEAIRRRGNEFARAQYSDDKLIGYLDNLLFSQKLQQHDRAPSIQMNTVAPPEQSVAA